MSDTTSDEKPTTKALEICAKWLSECLRLGWPKVALDDLEELWWKYRDRYGRLKGIQ